MGAGVFFLDFFGDDADATGFQALVNTLEHGVPFFNGDKLQAEVTDDDGSVFDVDILHVFLAELNLIKATIVKAVLAGIKHISGIIHSENLSRKVFAKGLAHGKTYGA